MYYRGAVAAIVAYDITNRKSFDGAKRWVQEVKQKGDPGIIVALAANKMDLVEKREVSFGEADEYAKENGLFHMETSAKTNVNVKSLFEKIDKNVPAEKRPADKAGMAKKRSLIKEQAEEKKSSSSSSMRSYFSSCCK
jgi:GTPase SAR1 family protein